MTSLAASQTQSDDFLHRVYPVLHRMAQLRWRRDETLVADTVSCGWEIYRRARADVTPGNIGHYAILTVASRRWLQGSKRCPSASPQTDTQPTVIHFDFDEYCSTSSHQDPARIAALHLDFTDWLETLTARQQQLVALLAVGESTSEAAQALGCTAGNISQYRRRLADSWYAYQS